MMHLHQSLHDCQPDAQPASPTAVGSRSLRKEVKHADEHVSGNADAAVAHADPDLLVVTPRAYPDFAVSVAELVCVVQEIQEDLFNAQAVASDRQFIVRELQLYFAMHGPRFPLVTNNLLEQLAQAELLHLQGNFPL